MSDFQISHKDTNIPEGTELILADSSVLSQSDILFNTHLKSVEQGQIFRETKQKSKGWVHSYNDPKNPSETQSSSPPNPASSEDSKADFQVPKKRIRIIDLNESPNEARKIARKVAKKVSYEEEQDERLSLELKINTYTRPSVKSTPATQEEDYDQDTDIQINPRPALVDPSLSLKDTGSKSVVFVPLPTERIQQVTEEKTENDWEHRDRPLGRGLSACLSQLREKKLLGKSHGIGRKNDKPGDEELQHFDQKGRPLSKKQAFRMQCYSFHNQKQNQNKITKIEDEIKNDLKIEKVNPALGSSSLRHIKSIMQKTQSNCVVISKG